MQTWPAFPLYYPQIYYYPWYGNQNNTQSNNLPIPKTTENKTSLNVKEENDKNILKIESKAQAKKRKRRKQKKSIAAVKNQEKVPQSVVINEKQKKKMLSRKYWTDDDHEDLISKRKKEEEKMQEQLRLEEKQREEALKKKAKKEEANRYLIKRLKLNLIHVSKSVQDKIKKSKGKKNDPPVKSKVKAVRKTFFSVNDKIEEYKKIKKPSRIKIAREIEAQLTKFQLMFNDTQKNWSTLDPSSQEVESRINLANKMEEEKIPSNQNSINRATCLCNNNGAEKKNSGVVESLETTQTSSGKNNEEILKIPQINQPENVEKSFQLSMIVKKQKVNVDLNSKTKKYEPFQHALFSNEERQSLLKFNNSSIIRGTYYPQIQIREWIDHVLDDELDKKILEFINHLIINQIVLKKTRPLKFQKKMAIGFHETMMTLNYTLEEKKPKAIILAINVLENNIKFGSDYNAEAIIKIAKEKKIPIIYSCLRKEIGLALYGKKSKKIARVACLSLLQIQGLEHDLKNILDLYFDLRAKWISHFEEFKKNNKIQKYFK